MITHEEWLENEGGIEGPTHKETLEQECQKRRIEWLIDNSVGDILEIGCNYGYIVADAATKTGGKGIGFDINGENIKLARKIYASRRDLYFFEVDVTKDWAEREFDTVMFPDVLEHIPEDKLEFVLTSAATVTKNNLLITLPWEEEKRHCFKHRWIVNEYVLDRIEEILQRHFNFIFKHCDGEFIFIKAKRM